MVNGLLQHIHPGSGHLGLPRGGLFSQLPGLLGQQRHLLHVGFDAAAADALNDGPENPLQNPKGQHAAHQHRQLLGHVQADRVQALGLQGQPEFQGKDAAVRCAGRVQPYLGEPGAGEGLQPAGVVHHVQHKPGAEHQDQNQQPRTKHGPAHDLFLGAEHLFGCGSFGIRHRRSFLMEIQNQPNTP